jgi:O-succinylbenzoate synthase
MIITSVSLYHVRMALVSPFETSFGRIETRDCVLIEAFAGGISGFGECTADRDPGYSYETCDTALHVLQDFIVPSVLNRNLDGTNDLQDKLSWIRGHPMAKAGLEMAMWDLLGKSQGRSLADMIGSMRQQVEVGVSVGIQSSPQDLVDAVDRYVSQGYRRIKIKIKPGRDIQDATAVRARFADVRLQVDANSAYTLASAEVLKGLDGMNLLLIEQPLAEDDLWDHSRLQAQFATPICLDESILSERHARQALEMGACRVINIKAGRVGGLSQAIAIHDLCYTREIPVWCGGMLETGVGRAANLALAGLPGFTLPGDISATERYYKEDITQEWFYLNPDSTITIPTAPGLGISVDRRKLKRYTLKKLMLT